MFAIRQNNNFDVGDPEDAAYLRRHGKRIQVRAGKSTTATVPFIWNR